MANGYGTSPAQLQEVMRAQAMLEASRNRPTQASQRGGISTTGDMTEYFKGELEAQRQSRVGQKIQKATMFPGMAMGMLARHSKEIDLEKKIEGLAKMMAGGGKGDTEAIVDAITKAGGLGYMASVAPLNVMRQKRLAYERGMKKQLGGVGTATSALDSLSMANRMLITPRVMSMIYGGGMPGSLQSAMGLYGAGIPMAKGIAGMMGTQLPSAMTTGLGGAALGAAPFMAAQMGLSMYKQKKIAAITAQRKAGSAEEAKLSLSKGLDSQINMLAQKGLIQPGEQIRIQLLKWIESHTAVLPEIWSEQQYIREEKEKGWRGAGQAYSKSLGEEEDLGFWGGLFDKTEAAMSKSLAKYDILGQVFNFITTGKLPKQFQEELEGAYATMSGEERREAKRLARTRGLSMDQSRLLEMKSSQLVDMAGSHETKMITILAAQFDIQRYFATEIMTIRKAGFGIPDNLIKSDDFTQTGLGKFFSTLKAPFEAIGNIPGLNAMFNLIKGAAGIPGAIRRGAGAAWGGIRNFMLGGEESARLLTSEEELRKEAGVYKSDQQMAYEYMGRGLPDIMEEMRFLGAVRAQLLTNIYHVVSAQLQATTGVQPQYDEKPFSQMTKKGVWSYTAGKYLNEKGLADQQKQDQERMEIALERAFRGSGMDRLGVMVDFITGRKRGTQGVQERLTAATRRVSKFETLPYELMQGIEGGGFLGNIGRTFGASMLQNIGEQEFVYTPQELIEAARYRQREMKGRGQARVVPGWMGAEQERAQMAMEQDVMPKIMRTLGIAAGGATSAAGMATLGLAASLLSGGSLIPILMAGAAGAGAGVIPQTKIELQAAQQLFGEVNLSVEDIRKLSLGIQDIPEGLVSAENRKKVLSYYNKVNPELVDKVIGKGKDQDAWFRNVNNFGYIMMALQGDTALGFVKTAEKAGIPVTAAQFKALGADMTVGDYKTMNDLYEALTDINKPVPVEIVKIGDMLSEGETGGSLPIHFRKSAIYEMQQMAQEEDLIAKQTIGRRRRRDEEEAMILEESSISQINDMIKETARQKESDKVRKQEAKAKVISFLMAQRKKLSDVERVKVDKTIAELSDAVGFQTGGTMTRDGLAFLHKGEEVVTAGRRTLQQELAEKDKKKWEQALLGKFEKMVVYLEDIAENTEELDEQGKGVKSGKAKKGGGMFGNIFGTMMSKIGGMFSSVLGAITGGLGIRGLLKMGGKSLWSGAKGAAGWLGRGLKGVGSKIGAGFMETGAGRAISNKLFDLQFKARGLAKQFAPSRLLGKGVAGAKDLLTRIPGLSRAGQFLSGAKGLAGRGLAALPGAVGKLGGQALGKAGGLLKGLGGVGLSALMGIGGTAMGAFGAQEKYGDVIGEDLSLMQKIGLGANTGLKAMTFGLLDVEKLTGAKEARESVIKAKEQGKKIEEGLQAKLRKTCSPAAFKIVKAAVSKTVPWSAAFMSVRNKEIIPGGEFSKYPWIVPGEEVTVNMEIAKQTIAAQKAKGKIEWHDPLVKSCDEYLFYEERGDTEGMQKAANAISVLSKGVLPVKQVVELYKKDFKQRIVDEGKPKKKLTEKEIIKMTATQKIKKAHDATMGAAGLAAAEAKAGIKGAGDVAERILDPRTGKYLTRQQMAEIGSDPWMSAGYGSEMTVPDQKLGFFARMKQAISREGGIFSAINSALSNVGPGIFGTEESIAGKMGSLETGALVWPGSKVITSPFGYRNTGLKGASKMHRGVDMRAGKIKAASGGIVTGMDQKWGAITIDHGDGVSTRYMHMNSFLKDLKVGDQVAPGQVIGIAGNTGPIPGMAKHLHFEIMKDGRKLDPELVYNAAGKFSPSYAPDIVPERQLGAKLAKKPIDPSKLKTEGAEAAGPFGFDMYDPSEIMGSLQKKIDEIGKQRVRREEIREYSAPSAPMVLPMPVSPPDSSGDNLISSKKESKTDSDLDNFINGLFCDVAYEFSQRYKKYAYHSNVGHSFN